MCTTNLYNSIVNMYIYMYVIMSCLMKFFSPALSTNVFCMIVFDFLQNTAVFYTERLYGPAVVTLTLWDFSVRVCENAQRKTQIQGNLLRYPNLYRIDPLVLLHTQCIAPIHMTSVFGIDPLVLLHTQCIAPIHMKPLDHHVDEPVLRFYM